MLITPKSHCCVRERGVQGIFSGGRNLLFHPLRSLTEKHQEAIDEKYFGLLKTWQTRSTYHDPQRERKFPFPGHVWDDTRQSSVGVAFIGILALNKGSDLDGLKWTHPVLGFYKASVGWIDWLVCPQPTYGLGNSWDYGRVCSWPGISVFPAFGAL